METPFHVDFQDAEPQGELREEVRRHIVALEKRFNRIIACRVAVKGPGAHHRNGGLFEVHVHLSLPDRKEVNVGRKPDADTRHADPRVAINHAFQRAGRVLEDEVRLMQGRVKSHGRASDEAD